MKSGFHDPIEPKIKKEKKNTPWDFRAPQYDERTSCFVNAGTHYGKCHKQPVGHEGNPRHKAEILPFGRPKTMEVDSVSHQDRSAEFQE